MATKDISDYDCCVAASIATQGRLRTGDVLLYRTGQHEKVCQRALERAVSRGYLGCGINEWNAWVEPKGQQLVELHKL